tara:strand:- start:224 stop:652 length:429 start_codon:yes stop_codon:yes gene_type:complete
MPNFKKSDGFSLGGNPFTMNKGSKEINTEGSFRQESTNKMGSYGSPLFAIAGREGRGAGAAYEDTTTDMAADVDAAMSEGKEVAGALGLGGEKETPSEESASALGNEELQEAKKSVIGDVKEQKIVDADDVEVAEIEEDIEL